MRKDLVLRYLNTSVDRLNLVQRHLNGDLTIESSTENPTTLKEHGESTFDQQVKSYVKLLRDQILAIEETLESSTEQTK